MCRGRCHIALMLFHMDNAGYIRCGGVMILVGGLQLGSRRTRCVCISRPGRLTTVMSFLVTEPNAAAYTATIPFESTFLGQTQPVKLVFKRGDLKRKNTIMNDDRNIDDRPWGLGCYAVFGECPMGTFSYR